MKFENIKEAFEFLRMDGSASNALIDCMNAYTLSKAQLEAHFDQWLWLPEDFEYGTPEDKAYSLELGRIEEFLCRQGFIYETE